MCAPGGRSVNAGLCRACQNSCFKNCTNEEYCGYSGAFRYVFFVLKHEKLWFGEKVSDCKFGCTSHLKGNIRLSNADNRF